MWRATRSLRARCDILTTSKSDVRLPERGRRSQAAANFALVGAASLSLAFGANAAAVKLGGDGGELQFVPSSVTIAKGESVTWCVPSYIPVQ